MFLPLEDNIHIFWKPCNIIYILSNSHNKEKLELPALKSLQPSIELGLADWFKILIAVPAENGGVGWPFPFPQLQRKKENKSRKLFFEQN